MCTEIAGFITSLTFEYTCILQPIIATTHSCFTMHFFIFKRCLYSEIWVFCWCCVGFDII